MRNINIYKQTRITEKGNKGWLFIYANMLSDTAISTEKQEKVFIEDKQEARDFLLR